MAVYCYSPLRVKTLMSVSVHNQVHVKNYLLNSITKQITSFSIYTFQASMAYYLQESGHKTNKWIIAFEIVSFCASLVSSLVKYLIVFVSCFSNLLRFHLFLPFNNKIELRFCIWCKKWTFCNVSGQKDCDIFYWLV